MGAMAAPRMAPCTAYHIHHLLVIFHSLVFVLVAVAVPVAARTGVDVVVTLKSRRWQADVRDLLLGSSCTRLHPSSVEFVWRTNPGAQSAPTDFGVLRLGASASYEVFRACLLESMGTTVRRVDRESVNGHQRSTLGWGAFDVTRHLPSVQRRGQRRGQRRHGLEMERTSLAPAPATSPPAPSPPAPSMNDAGFNNFIPSSIAVDAHRHGRTGKAVKVAIFDSGLNDRHPDFRYVRERTNWTSDTTIDDKIGHGSFVAGVIAGTSKECTGVAPDSELYIFRVFTSTHQSFTSWFLDAFNYALFLGVDVINFSIGGPDHFDHPFTDKVREMSANGVIVVSAVGNDGPLWGSIFSPADQLDVLSVGGWGKTNELAAFSSRGMTTAEISWGGMGLVKPDILAQSVLVYSSSANAPFKCTPLSGTSVAAPVVTGAVVALLSGSNGTSATPRVTRRSSNHNVAAIKQLVMTTARREGGDITVFEHGEGLLDLPAALRALPSHRPHASLHPARVSNLPQDCPYLWPWCRQALYVGAQPVVANLTLLNSMGVTGRVIRLQWTETLDDGTAGATVAVDVPAMQSSGATRRRTRGGHGGPRGNLPVHRTFTLVGRAVTVRVQCSEQVWPWTGFVAVAASATPSTPAAAGNGTAPNATAAAATPYIGVVSGRLTVTVESAPDAAFPASAASWAAGNSSYRFDPARGVRGMHVGTASMDIALKLQAPPPRAKRVLWDAFHNIDYPSAYVPRDELASNRNSFDWLGDHPYTNQRKFYNWLLDQGFYVEILRGPWTCFNASQYVALVVVDPEEVFHEQEVAKLEADIRGGLSLLLVADWWDELQLLAEEYEDENTRSLWHAVTGGANVPGINGLLSRFGASFGEQAFEGKVKVDGRELRFNSGNTVARWPRGGAVFRTLPNELKPVKPPDAKLRVHTEARQVVAGFLQVGTSASAAAGANASEATHRAAGGVSSASGVGGRVAVYGDSTCFEVLGEGPVSRHLDPVCETFFGLLIDFVTTGAIFTRSNSTTGTGTGTGTGGNNAVSDGNKSNSTYSNSTSASASASKGGDPSSATGAVLRPTDVGVPLLAALAQDVATALPAGASLALRSLWGQLELLSRDLHLKELAGLARPVDKAEMDKVEAHRRGRTWEINRVSKTAREPDAYAMCGRLL